MRLGGEGSFFTDDQISYCRLCTLRPKLSMMVMVTMVMTHGLVSMLESLWDDLGMFSGSMLDNFGITLRWFRDQFGIMPESS